MSRRVDSLQHASAAVLVSSLTVTLMGLGGCASTSEQAGRMSQDESAATADMAEMATGVLADVTQDQAKQALDTLKTDIKAANAMDQFGEQLADAQFAYNEGDYAGVMEIIMQIRKQMRGGQ